MKKNILLLGTSLFSALVLAQERTPNWNQIEYSDSVKLGIFEILSEDSFDLDVVWNREFHNGKAILTGFGKNLTSQINSNYQLSNDLFVPFITCFREGLEQEIYPGNSGDFEDLSKEIDMEECTIHILTFGYQAGVQIFVKNDSFEARVYKRERGKEIQFFYPKNQKLVLNKEPDRVRGILTGLLEGGPFESESKNIPLRIEIDFQKNKPVIYEPLEGHEWVAGFVESYKRKFGEEAFSRRFEELMSKQLKVDFHLKTGFSLKEKAGFIGLSHPRRIKEFEENDGQGSLNAGIIIIAHWIPTEVHWKSKDGNFIEPSQAEIKDDEIFFWFEKLDIDEAKRLINPPIPKLEIEPQDLSFDLKVEYFEVDLEFRLKMKYTSDESKEEIISLISGFVQNRNEKSEAQHRSLGLIHNFDISVNEESDLHFRFDWGSASLEAMVELLKMLSKTNKIQSVHIGSVF